MLPLCCAAGSLRSAHAASPWFSRRDLGGAAAGVAATSTTTAAAYAGGNGVELYPSTTTLADGAVFPLASFGLQIYDDATAERLTALALEAGFRNFFASVLAQNQVGFARAIKRSGLRRDELFICGSVVSNRATDEETAYKLTQLGCAENMQAFAAGDIEYLDMIMLDYPGPDIACIRGQWRAFEEMREAGLVRSLAVSNFSPAQLDAICLDRARATRPTVKHVSRVIEPHAASLRPPVT